MILIKTMLSHKRIVLKITGLFATAASVLLNHLLMMPVLKMIS